MNDEVIKSLFSFNELFQTLWRARYDQFVIELALAYDGYHFFLPAL